MSAFDRFDREFANAVVDLADPRTPDYIDEVLERAVRRRQRPAWTFPERWLPMGVLVSRPAFVPAFRWRTIGLLLVLAALLAAILAVGVGTLFQRTAPPFGVAGNGLIVYGVDGDILGRDPRTGEVRVLVGGPELDVGPWFSRDGSRFMFIRLIDEETQTAEVMVANADGSGVRTIVEPEVSGPLHWVEWSPEGDRIVLRNNAPGVPPLSIIDLRGTPQRTTIDVPLELGVVDWRPGTDELIVIGRDPTTQAKDGFYAIRTDGTVVGELVPPPTDGGVHHGPFSLSHDGRFMAFTSGSAAGTVSGHILDFDSSEIRPLGGPVNQAWPTFSPDGERLAMIRYRVNGATAQAFIAASSGDATDAVAIGPEVPNQPGTAGLRIQFSPDGTKLLIVHAPKDEAWIADVATGAYEPVELGEEEWVTWQRVAE